LLPTIKIAVVLLVLRHLKGLPTRVRYAEQHFSLARCRSRKCSPKTLAKAFPRLRSLAPRGGGISTKQWALYVPAQIALAKQLSMALLVNNHHLHPNRFVGE
jgi:hypothetical protein